MARFLIGHGELHAFASEWIRERVALGAPLNLDGQFDFAITAMEAYADAMADQIEAQREYEESIKKGTWPLRSDVPGKGLWWVYFLFRGDELVYIGVTGNLRQRLKAHKSTRGPLIERWAALPFCEKEDAYAAEQRFIGHHKPEMNSWSGQA